MSISPHRQRAFYAALATVSYASLTGTAFAAAADDQSGNDIVVTASSVATTIKDAPASISVIGADDLERRPATDINDILSRAPGISKATTPDGGTSIQVRGLPQNYTLVLLDGQRMGSSGDTFDRYSRNELNWIPQETIERIEIVRGPMSSLYGADAMGGVINVITKNTYDRWRGALQAGTVQPEATIRGSDYMLNGFVSGPLGGGFGIRLTGGITEQQADRGLPDGTTSFRWGGGREGSKVESVGARLNWQSADERHTINAFHDISRARTFPGPAPTTSNPGGVSASTRGPSKMDRTNTGANYTGKFDFGTARLAAYQTRYANATTAPVIVNGVPVTGSTQAAKAVAKDFVIDGSLAMPFELGVRHSLTVGGQFIRSSLDNPNSVGNQPNTDGVAGLSFKRTTSYAAFAEDQIALLDILTLTLGLRADHHSDYGTHVTPRAYAVLHPFPDLTIKGGYAEGFRPPSLRQSNPNFISASQGAGCSPVSLPGYVGGGCYTLGQTGLDPETTKNWEIGANYESGGFQAGLTFFDTRFQNKIDVAPIGYRDGFTQYWAVYTNIDSAVTRGLEANVSIPLIDNPDSRILRGLTLQANGTHMFKSENTDTGEPLATTPQWAANATLAWRVNEDLSLTFDAQYIGKQVGLDLRIPMIPAACSNLIPAIIPI
jgi:outer membrane receptor for ferrienterochelin and colicins